MSYYLGFEPTGDGVFFFVSYKRTDRNRIAPFTRELNRRGIPMWYDQDIQTGTEWEAVLAEKIRKSQGVILFVSRHIFERTNTGENYVQLEYKVAKRNGKQIIPVFLDRLSSQGVPPEYAFWYEELAAIQGVAADDSVNPQTAVQGIYQRLDAILRSAAAQNGSYQDGSYQNGSYQGNYDAGSGYDTGYRDSGAGMQDARDLPPEEPYEDEEPYEEENGPKYRDIERSGSGARIAVPVVIIAAALIFAAVMVVSVRRNHSTTTVPSNQPSSVEVLPSGDASATTEEIPAATEQPQELPADNTGAETADTSAAEAVTIPAASGDENAASQEEPAAEPDQGSGDQGSGDVTTPDDSGNTGDNTSSDTGASSSDTGSQQTEQSSSETSQEQTSQPEQSESQTSGQSQDAGTGTSTSDSTSSESQETSSGTGESAQTGTEDSQAASGSDASGDAAAGQSAEQ